MAIDLRDYQELGYRYYLKHSPTRVLFVSPTGTGKTYLQLKIYLDDPKNTYVISPKIEILEGYCKKLGWSGDPEDHNFFTPIRLRNLLAKGEIGHPHTLIVDEAHHGIADSYEELYALANSPKLIGFTASPFRGTPKGTKQLLDFWGDPVWLVTYKEAFDRGYISCPNMSIVPLVDDDIIEVTNGEFNVESANEAIGDCVTAVVELCGKYVQETEDVPYWDRPTIISVPSTESAKVLERALNNAKIPSVVLLADTKNRNDIFTQCIECYKSIIFIDVISEGIDFPFRRLIDLQPTMSPVRWLQRLGRIERLVDSNELPPEYICCCRNLLRHAYVLDGVVKPAIIAQGIQAFGSFGKRSGLRVLGFENLGRFKATEVPCADGTVALFYCLSKIQDNQVHQYAVIVSSNKADPICAKRINPRGLYDRWVKCSMPEITQGYASVPAKPLSDKQLVFWKNCAKGRGLDEGAEINNRQFQCMPVLLDLRCTV
jgi:hypothetical protein